MGGKKLGKIAISDMTMESRRYQTAGAFRRALEDRLKQMSEREGKALDRLRREVAFDRFLARLFDDSAPPWLLKGGYALELRLQTVARATKDLDFTIPEIVTPTAEKIRDMIQEYTGKDLGDWFSFLIGAPTQELDQVVYGGWRYPVDARLDNRSFSVFHVDVGVGDAVITDPEWVTGREILSFAGIAPPRIALLPREQQFAEKVHAYSFPRSIRAASRVRDLVDLVLLMENGLPERQIMQRATRATFERRKTHSIPARLEVPPETWGESYKKMAEECGVSKKTVEEAFHAVDEYWAEIFA